MELRKEYIKRLLPVLGVIVALILIILGHNVLKTKAAEADNNERRAEEALAASNEDAKRSKELDDLKSELTNEIYSIVEKSIYESLSNIDLSTYLTEEDYLKIAENVENSLMGSDVFISSGKELSAEQKTVIEKLISDAIDQYALNANATISDAMKENLLLIIDDRLTEQLSKIEMSSDFSDDEKSKIASDIANEVRGDVLSYVVEHIQILYGDGEPTCGHEEHVHSDDCYERELICGREENGEHTHGDECYEKTLVCDKDEHIHEDSCYQYGQGSSPCVHVHVDYLLTDDDKREIIAGVIDEADFARLLSEVFYGEIEKQMPSIIQDAFFREVYDLFNGQLDAIRKDMEDNATVRYFNGYDEVDEKNKSCLQVKVNGEWVDFISANSLAATGYLITVNSSGETVFAEGFTGLKYAGGGGSVSPTSVYIATSSTTPGYLTTCYAETSTFRIDNNLAKRMAFKMSYSGYSRQYTDHGRYSTAVSYTVAILDGNDDSKVYATKTFFSESGYCYAGYAPSGTSAFTIDLPTEIYGKDIKLKFTCSQSVSGGGSASDGTAYADGNSRMTINSITLID